MDSPANYVQMLTMLFDNAQLLDVHTAALLSPGTLPYASFSPDARAATEARLRHVSEFFARVVLTFVVRDLSMLLDRYAKNCQKWLGE
jgi:hypothetical protein